MGDQTDQTDPTKQYEQLEHTDEQQPHPGVTQATQDQPDQGEDSYRGSRRLTGKRTVITGAGNVQWQQARNPHGLWASRAGFMEMRP